MRRHTPGTAAALLI